MQELPFKKSVSTEQIPAVLSVEDEDGVFWLIERAFQELESKPTLYRVETGEDALAFLRRTEGFADAPTPSLVLLNIHLPVMSGIDVLKAIQSDPAICGVPVVIFSSANLDAHRAKCLALGAKDFIPKPNRYHQFVDAVRSCLAHALVSTTDKKNQDHQPGTEAEGAAAGLT